MKVIFKVFGLREFCIERNLYTCGDNEEYSRLLAKEGQLDLDEIRWIALDIIAHSETDYTVEEMMEAILNTKTYFEVQ